MFAIQDNILRSCCLITITWQNNSYVSDRGIWGLIVMPITSSKAKDNPTLLLLRHVSGQFKCLFIVLNSRMMGSKHFLQLTQSCSIQTRVPGICHAVCMDGH